MEFLKRLCFFVLLVTLSSNALHADECRQSLQRLSSKELKPAFTITELLVTVSIIGILTAVLIPSLSKSRNSARNLKCQVNLHQVQLATAMYEDVYKSLPVHAIDNTPPNVHASVDLRLAMEIDPGIRPAFRCPEDKGLVVPETGEWIFYSYMYRGLDSMLSRRPPFIFNPQNSRNNYEADLNRPLYYRLPLWHDARGFHESRGSAPNYDGKMNAAWYDGRVERMPTSPPPTP